MGVVMGAAVGFLFLSAIIVGVGVWTTRWIILPRTFLPMEGTGSVLRVHLSRLVLFPAILLPLTLVLILVRQIADFRDPFAPLLQDLSLLLGSSWGNQWIFGMAGSLLALGGGILIRRMNTGGWWFYFLGVMAATAFSSLSGHAGGTEGPTRLMVLPADLLHLLGAGVWVGSLATVLALEIRWRRRAFGAGEGSILPALIPAFSPLALAGAGTLGATGILAAWVHLPEPMIPWSTGYGQILLLKLGMVIGILGLGAWNWKLVTPRLSAPGGPEAMRRSAGMELGMAALVILVTAFLIRTSPGAGP